MLVLWRVRSSTGPADNGAIGHGFDGFFGSGTFDAVPANSWRVFHRL